MKKLLLLMLALALVFAFAACAPAAPAEQPAEQPADQPEEVTPAPENPVIRLSTTTSVNDSGLLPYLQPYFEAATGYSLEITSAGTGAAIEKARTGDADALLVHSKSAEEEFIGEGYNEERVPFMYNYFIIAGPVEDPADVADQATAAEAFAAIAAGGYTFISRGDESGTHNAEKKIWAAADIEPAGDWYNSIGDGMGAALNIANEQQAYLLSDKGTYLAHEDDLVILLERSDEMKNTYSMIAITPDRYADTNYAGALAFIEWMTTDEALGLIAEYGVAEYGEPLFYVL